MVAGDNPQSCVLIADDETAFAQALSAALRSDGFAVAVAGCGPACTQLLASGADLHAIVIEPNLAGGVWYQLLRMAARSASRLLVVTAFWSQALAEEAAAAGAEACLRKPVSPRDVRELLQTAPRVRQAFQPPARRRPASLACVEWEYLNQMIRDCRGNMSQAARLLGIHRPSLYKKLRKHPPPR